MTSTTTSERARERGAALIVVLWTFAVLAALAGQFAIAMRREAEGTLTFKQEAQARYTALAALNEAILSVQAFNGELDYTPEEERLGDAAAEVDEEEGLNRIRTLLEGRGEWVEGAFPPGEGWPYRRYEVRAVDETGKIPINADAVDDAVLREILLNLGYDELTASTVADSIMDWRDEDDLHRAEGAEDDYYEGLERPYPCKDAPLDALEELLLIRGVTRTMYYGDGTVPGLREIFTVAHDRGRITVRSAPPAVEWALCGDPELRGADDREFRTRDQQEIDLQACIQTMGLGVRRGERQGRPQLGIAMLEARVRDPANEERTLAHAGVLVSFKGDGGFQTLQWYDSIFED